jgi:osmotically-inducible protein OsmY
VPNDELRFDVDEELFWEPRVDNEAIAVSADGGDVTLRGTVGSFREKREAAKAAKRVYGVKSVDNELSVRLLDGYARDDEIELTVDDPTPDDVRHSIKKAFKRDARLDAEALSIDTFDGTVTLSGDVDSWVERDAAVDAAWAAPGVRAVDDEIVVDYRA